MNCFYFKQTKKKIWPPTVWKGTPRSVLESNENAKIIRVQRSQRYFGFGFDGAPGIATTHGAPGITTTHVVDKT